jgi:hypothetical protein
MAPEAIDPLEAGFIPAFLLLARFFVHLIANNRRKEKQPHFSGSSRHNEGFTEDYDLPNKTAYCS